MIRQSSSAGPCKYLHNYVKFLPKKERKFRVRDITFSAAAHPPYVTVCYFFVNPSPNLVPRAKDALGTKMPLLPE